MESQKYKLGGSNDIVSGDGGTLATVYEKGSKLGLEPLDYGDPSLVGYWTFDEGTGTTAWDYSGNNATGSWSGTGTHWAAGRVGNGAGQFATSTGDYVSINLPSIFPTTIIVWANPYISGSPLGIMNSPLGTGVGYLNAYLDGSLHPYFYTSNNDLTRNALYSPSSLNLNSWSQIVFVMNNGKRQIYINGISVASDSETSYPVNINLIGSVGGYFFSGLIDDVRIYNRALSAAEISALYAGGK
jgi:hypothetical protein